MLLKKRFKFLMFIIVLTILAPISFAANFYVSTTGSDSNSCTAAQNINTPKRTVNGGISCLAAGNTLLIRAGTYPESFWGNIPSGASWSSPVTLKAYQGETVTLKPSGGDRVMHFQGQQYIVIDGLIIDGSNVNSDAVKITSGGGVPGAHHIRFQNCEIRNAPKGQGILITPSASDNEVLNCKIHNNGHAGTGIGATGHGYHGVYWSSGGNNKLIGNDIYNNADYGAQLGGTFDDLWVEGNRFHDNGGGGLNSYGLPNNLMIVNNLVYHNGLTFRTAGIDIYGANNVKVYSNTVYGNIGPGISYDSGLQWDASRRVSVYIRNTISYGNGLDFSVGDSRNLIQNNNLFSTDPKFVNAAGNDFHLQSTSPAINTGVTLAEVTKDFDGIARPQGSAYDIGAYEYTGGVIIQPASFDFSLSNGGSKTVTQGSSTTNTITATLSSGTTQSVSFSDSGLPSGAQASFSPTSCSPTCTTTMTINTASTTSAGTYTITVTGTGSGVTKSTTFSLTVGATTAPDTTPPVRSNPQPTGILPAGTVSTTLSLNTNEPATCRYATAPNTPYSAMTNSLVNTGGTTHSTVVSGLTNGKSYLFYVKCRDVAGNIN